MLREQMEPLLFRNSVDLALWGHTHQYERTKPVFEAIPTAGGPVHVVIGPAGAIRRTAWAPEQIWDAVQIPPPNTHSNNDDTHTHNPRLMSSKHTQQQR